MTAIDTNIVVRSLTGDDSEQTAAARSVLIADSIWISASVFLESAWVLQNLYEFDTSEIREAFTKLLGLENIYTDHPSMAAALALTHHGVEIADAIHLTSRPPSARFLTFDRRFVNRATRAGESNVGLVLSRSNALPRHRS